MSTCNVLPTLSSHGLLEYRRAVLGQLPVNRMLFQGAHVDCQRGLKSFLVLRDFRVSQVILSCLLHHVILLPLS